MLQAKLLVDPYHQINGAVFSQRSDSGYVRPHIYYLIPSGCCCQPRYSSSNFWNGGIRQDLLLAPCQLLPSDQPFLRQLCFHRIHRVSHSTGKAMENARSAIRISTMLLLCLLATSFATAAHMIRSKSRVDAPSLFCQPGCGSCERCWYDIYAKLCTFVVPVGSDSYRCP